MAHTNLLLSIRCFGSLQITLNGRALPAFDTDKTGALLAYLLLEGQALRRARLAAFFWPEMDESRARANLSQALYLLRKAIPTAPALPLLLADARAVQVNPALPLVCDAIQLQAIGRGCSQHQPRVNVGCAACLAALPQVADLYRGELLAGLSLPDCAEFEEWLRTQRQHYHRLTCVALQQLADWQQQCGDHAAALATCHQWLAIDPLAEAGHHQLMTLLAQSDQRAAALAAFERYRQRLQTELNAEPAAPITSLYLQLRNNHPILRQRLGHVTESPNPPMGHSPHFVGRPAELAHLQSVLTQVVAGQGRAIFVTGEAGFGKSALMQAFAQHAQQLFPALLVAGGNCNAYTGFGDPYLPLREILALLTGDTETQQQAGALTSAHTARLQTLAPQAIQALIEVAPDLLGTLIAPTALLTRSAKLIGEPSVKAQLQRLAAQKAREQTHSSAARPQTAIFEQVTKLLQRLAATAPLLLLVDDLQWADMGTISLLFHLARHLSHSPILLVGAFRPSEVLAGNQSNGQRWATGAQHPLAALYYEMQRQWGAIEVALEAADGQRFVAALVDRQPNQLDDAFRTRLHQYTHGNALFTVELLAGMQARGDLVRSADGRWLASATLDWETLPPRIEGVIAQRVARLPVDLRETLALASVMGENFQAEVLAGVQGVDRRQMVRWLSSELDRQHGLVTLQGIEPRGEQSITRYRFRHILFQKYLYQRLDAAERSHLHSTVGATLEMLYQGQSDALEDLASELARHFAEAKQWLKAAEWLLVNGRKAFRLSALDEAENAFTQAIARLQLMPHTKEHAKLELQLQIALGGVIYPRHNFNERLLQCYDRAEVLSRKLGDSSQYFQAIHGLSRYNTLSGDLRIANEFAMRMLKLAENDAEPTWLLEANVMVGATCHWLGRFTESIHYSGYAEHLLADLNPDHPLFRHGEALYGENLVVHGLNYVAYSLWQLGYPDKAMIVAQKAIAFAKLTGHPNSIAYALNSAAYVYCLRREPIHVFEITKEMEEIQTKFGITFWPYELWRAWALLEQGDLVQATQAFTQRFPMELNEWVPSTLTIPIGVLAAFFMSRGEYATALDALQIGMDSGNVCGGFSWNAEFHRMSAQSILMSTPKLSDEQLNKVEFHLHEAISLASSQKAKSWELRATVDLSRLLIQRGNTSEAQNLLQSVCEWFKEGFDTRDYQEATELLHSIGK